MRTRLKSVIPLAFTILMSLAAFADDRALSWNALMDAGIAATEAGELETAQARFERALALARAEPPDKAAIGSSLNGLGACLTRMGRHDEALRHLEQARELLAAARGADHPDAIPPLNNLAVVYGELGQYDRARAVLGQTLAIERKHLGDKSERVAMTRIRLANTLTRTREFAAAETEYRTAIGILESTDSTTTSAQLRGALSGLGNLYREMGRLDESRAVLERVAALRPDDAAETRGEDAAALLNLGAAKLAAGEFEAGLALLREGLPLLEHFLAPDHPQVGNVHLNIGSAEASLGRIDRAEASFARACEILGAALPAAHPNLLRCLKNHARALAALGRKAEAAAVERRIEAARSVAEPAPG